MPLDVPDGTTDRRRSSSPSACRTKLVHLVLVNGVYVPPEQRAERVLKDGDVLAIWPPIAGG